ncbi:hypothetical protein DRQ53_03065 [bacterium]|nr:MAG: hypothetical protein DRQ53_03065 [bacterium]
MNARRFLATLVGLLMSTGCNSSQLDGQRAEHPIQIDGDPIEWAGMITEVEDADYDFGYANDDDYLYLCIIVDGDQLRRQALAGGVYFWFDPAGGEERVVGLRYPIGLGSPAGAGSSAPEDREAMRLQYESAAANSLQRVALTNASGTEELRLSDLDGVDVNGMLTSRSLVLEMRIPLREFEGANLALGMHAGAAQVGVQIYVPRLEAPPRPSGQSRGSAAAGGKGGGGGGRGGGGRGGGGGGRGGGPPAGASGADEIQVHIAIPLVFSSSPGSSTQL